MVDRYEMCGSNYVGFAMQKHDEGDYVRHEDYLAIVGKLDEVRAIAERYGKELHEAHVERETMEPKLPSWRIIADELPPLRVPVLCCSPSGLETLCLPTFVSYRFRDPDEGTPLFYHELPKHPVTHWMPLPEAP